MLRRGIFISIRPMPINGEFKINNCLRVQLRGERPLIFEDVIARVSDQFALDMHIDTDEGNAAGVKTGDEAESLYSNVNGIN